MEKEDQRCEKVQDFKNFQTYSDIVFVDINTIKDLVEHLKIVEQGLLNLDILIQAYGQPTAWMIDIKNELRAAKSLIETRVAHSNSK